jgi:hypothetical protein
MRGGGIAPTLGMFWLGLNPGSNVPIAAPFSRPAPKLLVATDPPPRPPPPPPRANEAAGIAKTMNNAMTFTEVFDMGETPLRSTRLDA